MRKKRKSGKIAASVLILSLILGSTLQAEESSDSVAADVTEDNGAAVTETTEELDQETDMTLEAASEAPSENNILSDKTSDEIESAETSEDIENREGKEDEQIKESAQSNHPQGFSFIGLQSIPESDSDGTLIFEEDFEGTIDPSIVDMGGEARIIEIEGNKVLEFNDTSNTETTKTNFSIGDQEGIITIAWDLWVVSDENKSTVALTAGSRKNSGKPSSSSAGEFLRFKTTGDGSRSFEFRGGDKNVTPPVKTGSYEPNTLMRLKVVIDTEQEIFTPYVDGVALGEAMSMSNKQSGMLLNEIDNFSFQTGSKDTTHVYIDNVRVYIEEAESQEVESDLTPLDKSPADIAAIDFYGDNWKIQLPIESDKKPGSVMEKTPSELAAGYRSKYLFVAEDDNGREAVIFHCPVKGFKTGNTTYARSELREMLDHGNTAVNWSHEGTHTLTAEQRVTHVPANGKVITSQIHGIEQNGDNANPLVKVQYRYYKDKGTGSVNVQLKDTTLKSSADFTYEYPNVDLGEIYKTEIQVVDGSVYVTIESEDSPPQTYSHNFLEADPYWGETRYYFKLGNYIQDANDSSDTAYADVWVYDSSVTHSEEVTEIPVRTIAMVSDEITLGPGERSKLDVTVEPIKAYDKSVSWSIVSGEDVVAVDNNGNISAIKLGEAVVEAVSNNNPSAFARASIKVETIEAEEAEELYAEDFGSDPSADTESAFDTDFLDMYTVTADDVSVDLIEEDGNVVLQFRDDSYISPAKAAFVFTPQYETTTIMYRIRIDHLGEHKEGALDAGRLYAVAAASDEWYSNTTELFRIRNNADGTLGNYSNLTYVLTNAYKPLMMNADKVIGDYGDWVDVVYVVTPDNGTAKANTTDVYMNGYPVGLNIANRNNLPFVNRFDIQSGSSDKMTFSIDDVKIYRGAKIPSADHLPSPQSLELVGVPEIMGVGDSVKTSVNIMPEDSYDGLKYEVTSGDAVTISNDGFVIARKAGRSEIKVSSTKDPDVYATAEINVRNEEELIRVESLKFLQNNLSLGIGEKTSLQVVLTPDNASEQGVKFELISGRSILSIDAEGNIEALKTGSAQIKAVSLDNPEIVDFLDVSVVKKTDVGEIIYEDDFAGDKLDNEHWSLQLAKNYTFVDVKDNTMIVTDGNNAAQPKAILDFDPSNGQIGMQFKIKIHDEVETQGGIQSTDRKNIRISFGQGKITSTKNEAFTVRSNGTNFTYGTGGSNYDPIPGDYDLGEWNTISLITTINPDGRDTTDIYINGDLMIKGALNKTDFPTIDKMAFAADTSKYAAYSISDLKIWAGNYEDLPGNKPEETEPSETSAPSETSGEPDESEITESETTETSVHETTSSESESTASESEYSDETTASSDDGNVTDATSIPEDVTDTSDISEITHASGQKSDETDNGSPSVTGQKITFIPFVLLITGAVILIVVRKRVTGAEED